MEKIIDRIDRELILQELTPDKFLRHTNKGGNDIYITTAAESPNIMKEIGRLREWSFRLPGGGTGKSYDVDEFDFMDKAYKQLFVWDPQNQEILGGYRFIQGKDLTYDEKGQPNLATSEIFHFSDTFKQKYIPTMIELGRSFVHPDYQATKMGAKSLFALDNLWDGLGALIVELPETEYFFGKVTIYPKYDVHARDLILSFISKYYRDEDNLITPVEPMHSTVTKEECDSIFNTGDYKEDFKNLNHKVRELGVNIPPLVSAYISLAPRMRYFGAAVCHSFGDVIEFGLLIDINAIYDDKKRRHIESFLNERNERTKGNI